MTTEAPVRPTPPSKPDFSSVGITPKGEESLTAAIESREYDIVSSIAPSAGLLREILPADTASTTYARVTVAGRRSNEIPVRVPLTLFVIVDHSEHMLDQNLEIAKNACSLVMQALQPGDKCTIITCGSVARILVHEFTKGKESLSRHERTLLSVENEEGCDLVGAFVMAGWRARQSRADERASRIFLFSNGKTTNDTGLVHIVKDLARDAIYTHVYGIGDDFNCDLLIPISSAGLGSYHHVKMSDMQRFSDILQQEVTRNELAGRNVKVCLRPRHSKVDIDAVYSFDFVKEDDTFIVPLGDIYYEEHKDLLCKLAFKMRPSRKEILEVHISHFDAYGEQHLKTFQLTSMFTVDEVEVANAPPDGGVVDKVLKVNTAQALKHVVALIKDKDVTGGIDVLNQQIQRLIKAHTHGSSVLVEMAEELRDVALKYDAAEIDFDVMKNQLLGKARALLRE